MATLGRIYDQPFNLVSQTTGPTELVLLKNTVSTLVKLRRWSTSITTVPLPSAQQIQVVMYQVASGYTPGSGGAGGTIVQHDLGDHAARATTVIGNTTPSSVGLSAINTQGMYIYQGLDQVSWESVPIVKGEAFSLQMFATIGVQNVTGYVEWEEIGVGT